MKAIGLVVLGAFLSSFVFPLLRWPIERWLKRRAARG